MEWVLKTYQDKVALACSLSAEDTVLLHILASINKNVRVFVLDTGRLHEETYETLESCRSRYGLKIELYFPENFAVQELVTNKGSYSFYESLENRKECCSIRKVEPLKRALHGLDAWISGLRRAQSITRTEMQMLALDTTQRSQDGTRPLLKVNPLLNWSWEQVLDFAEKNKVHSIPCMRKAILALAVPPVRALFKKVKNCAQDVGGGNRLKAKNAVCISKNLSTAYPFCKRLSILSKRLSISVFCSAKRLSVSVFALQNVYLYLFLSFAFLLLCCRVNKA